MGQCGTKLPKEHVAGNTVCVRGGARPPLKRAANCCLTPPPVTPIVTSIQHHGYSKSGGARSVEEANKAKPPSTIIHNDSIHNDANREIDHVCHSHSHSHSHFQATASSQDNKSSSSSSLPARIDLDLEPDNKHKHDVVVVDQQKSIRFRLQDLDMPTRKHTDSVSSSFGFETLKSSRAAEIARDHFACHEDVNSLPASIVYHRHEEEECKVPAATTSLPLCSEDGVAIDSESELQNESLIQLKFTRTLFCEDITYEYEMRCNIDNTPQWICRLTVETLTKFYLDTVQKWQQRHQQQSADGDITGNTSPFRIPCQFGKVMTPKVFTSLIETILQQPAIFRDALFTEQTANFLMIPHELRCLLQYNPYQYVYGKDLASFKFCDVICNNEEKFKYLCHSQAVYRHDYEYDDCCQCYDEPQVTSYSYWIRSLQHKTDFLVNCTSNNIFSIAMTDLPWNVMNILKNDIGFDENSAWIITDYLPKYLLFNHEDERCNAQIIYKYNERDFCRTESEIYYNASGSMLHQQQTQGFAASGALHQEDSDECFVMDTNFSTNSLLQRHKQMDVAELAKFCKCMCCLHTAIKCVPEMTPSVSEYIESMSIAEVNDEDEENMMLRDNTLEDTVETEAYSHPPVAAAAADDMERNRESVVYDSISDDKYEVFFNAFIDEEGDDDINICQWLCSLSKLHLNLTEKQIVAAFNFIGQQNEEDHHGFVDFIDFTNFCRTVDVEDGDVKKVQQSINRFISKNST